ncbi:unnamed protein product [Moneuplotes crassus]|uniref:Uncharacterized protein n=1 Tax=Euplotes crassus TaxID=5936 RepID=A0AAD2D9A9_EUPCR|nr:unnamed protein product [Moneuplotes crassus]
MGLRLEMTIKKKFICDYCKKTFVSSRFFKKSHFWSLAHQAKLGKHYSKILQKEKNKRSTCAHKEVFGTCKFGWRCNERYWTVKDKQSQAIIGQWYEVDLEEELKQLQNIKQNLLNKRRNHAKKDDN